MTRIAWLAGWLAGRANFASILSPSLVTAQDERNGSGLDGWLGNRNEQEEKGMTTAMAMGT